ncbi:MAG TPA: hypothetical protein VGS19_17640 [Streptosporangiaceae bacterium]|nr:hypothetical protein [Streptosporangiaceae bacterium]
MRGSGWGGQLRGRLAGRRTASNTMVRLVTRLVTAQAFMAAAVGLLFSRRHLASVLITLALVAACCVLALMVRTGARASWVAATGWESAFFVFGLSRFLAARYVGGTLFALVITVTLLHPGVVRAYGVVPARLGGDHAEEPLGDGVGDTLHGRAAG